VPGANLYVSNVAWEAGWQDLKDHFKQFGQVTFCDIVRDKETGGARHVPIP
jgi:RNA recognition motif-containing protein